MAGPAKHRFKGSRTLVLALAVSSTSVLAGAIPSGNLTAATLNQTFDLANYSGTDVNLTRRHIFPNPWKDTVGTDPRLIETTPKPWEYPFPVNVWREQKWGKTPESVCIWKVFVTPDVKEPALPGLPASLKLRIGLFWADILLVRGTSHFPTTPINEVCAGRFYKQMEIACQKVENFRCNPYPARRPDEWGTMRISFVSGYYPCTPAAIHKAMSIATDGEVKLSCLEQGVEVEVPYMMPAPGGGEWAGDPAYYIDQAYRARHFGQLP
jgi:hypothetical protein